MMNKLKQYPFILSLFILFFSFVSFNEGFTTNIKLKREVLVIHSYHPGLSWSDNISKGIRQELESETNIDIYTEFLDTKHVLLEDYEKTYVNYFAEKYAKLRPEIIVACDNDALNFVLRNRDQIFKDIPVVFCGINNFSFPIIQGQKNISGVIEETSPLKTMNLLIAQNPEIKRLIILSDQTTTGKNECLHTEKVINQINKKIQIEWWTDLNARDLQPKLSKLGSGDVVLLIVYNRDASGNYFSYEESGKMITGYCPVPVYSLWDFYFGYGVVGGCLANSTYQGISAGQIVKRVLKNENIDSIPINMHSPNKYMLDAQLVEKFNLNPVNLNEPIEYVNKRPNWIRENILIISIVLSLLVVEAFVIILLFWLKHKGAKKLIAVLKINENRFYQMFNQHSAVMIMYNPETGNIVDANIAAMKFYGYTHDEFCQLSIYQINCKDKVYVDACLLEAKLLQKNNFIHPHRLSSGEIRTVEVFSSPFDTIKGTLLLSIVTDITEKVKAENALISSRENFKKFFESVNDMMFVLDKNGSVLFVNSDVTEKLGYSTQELEHFDLFDQHQLRQQKQVNELINDLVSGENEYCRFSLKTKEGILIPVVVLVWFGKWFERDCVFMIAKDLSQLAALGKFIKLFDNNPSMMAIVRAADLEILDVNKTFIQKLKYEKNELIGNSYSTINIELNSDDNTYGYINSDFLYSQKVQIKTKEGESIFGLLSQEPVDINSEKVFLVVITDITNQVKAELELKEKSKEVELQNNELRQTNEDLIIAKLKAEESDRLKSAFLANMSHEVRTPLNGILGFSQLLNQEDISSEEQQQFLNVIKNCGNQLLTIIDDIIDISKIESNQIKIIKHSCTVNNILAYCFRIYSEKFKNAHVDFSYSSALTDDNSVIITDSARLQQVLMNLLSNALKYTPQGSVKYGYSVKGDYLEFFVEDTGIGVEEHMKTQIFERFIQVETEYSKMTGGTGLGLAISKSLVEMLGGKLWMQSVYKEGSTFYFTIPYIKPTQSYVEVKSYTEPLFVDTVRKKKILIVEDEELNFQYIVKLLSEFDCDIIHASNGLDAIEIVRSILDIDLILMDIRMPKVNGEIATQEIRKFNKDIPIIAQTAYAQNTDKESALEHGCTDYISKPFTKEDFVGLIKKYL